jgi:hypothetical protein
VGWLAPVVRYGLSLLAALSLTGCPRDPEEGTGDGDEILVTLSNPDSVLHLIHLSVEAGNIASYMNAFESPAYAFIPDPSDRSALLIELGQDVFLDWGVDEEQQAASSIFSLSDSLRLTFSRGEDDSLVNGDGTVTLREDYELVIEATTYRGRADLQMRFLSGAWRVMGWVDNRPPTPDPTWGILKGRNR